MFNLFAENLKWKFVKVRAALRQPRHEHRLPGSPQDGLRRTHFRKWIHRVHSWRCASCCKVGQQERHLRPRSAAHKQDLIYFISFFNPIQQHMQIKNVSRENKSKSLEPRNQINPFFYYKYLQRFRIYWFVLVLNSIKCKQFILWMSPQIKY